MILPGERCDLIEINYPYPLRRRGINRAPNMQRHKDGFPRRSKMVPELLGGFCADQYSIGHWSSLDEATISRPDVY